MNRALKKSRHEKNYAKANNYFTEGTKKSIQKGVDLLETIPGIDDIYYQTIGTDISSFYVT